MKKSWGLLPKILGGEKTIESRWYLTRHMPWDRVHVGDVVYFKNSGEPVTVRANVERVLQLDQLTSEKVKSILDEYASRDGITQAEIPKYFELFKDKRYCILVFLENARDVESFEIDKTGFGMQAAWIAVANIESIRRRQSS